MVNHITDREEKDAKFYTFNDQFLTRCFYWPKFIEVFGILVMLLVLTVYISVYMVSLHLFLVVSCAQCPNASTGQICESRYKLPVSCNAGEIPSNNGTVCIRCRPGYFCRTPQEGEVPCTLPGQYSLGGATECKDCPLGYACANSGSLPQPCPLGEYADVKNSHSCSQCKPGFKCSATTGGPVACTPGIAIPSCFGF